MAIVIIIGNHGKYVAACTGLYTIMKQISLYCRYGKEHFYLGLLRAQGMSARVPLFVGGHHMQDCPV
jgi:hypothetical protein